MTAKETGPIEWLPDLGDYAAKYPEGVFDEWGYQYFLPVGEFKVVNSTEVTVGYSGWGGIEFRMKADSPGVWAFLPIEERYLFLGDEFSEVVAGWLNGTVTV